MQIPDPVSSMLAATRTIAMIGLSARPERASHGVAGYLQSHGYRIIPVNPTYAGTHILSEHCYPTLTLAAASLAAENIKIGIVNCFRKSEAIAAIAEEAIAIGAQCLWMQPGVVNQAAADRAAAAGLLVVMDRCIRSEHRRAV